MRRAGSSTELVVLVRLLDEAYNKRSWHGANLRGSIRGLTAEQAAWRPAAGKHSIADIVVHCAYWKYVVRRRLLGGKRGAFALAGSNWFKLPEPLRAPQWREYVALLDREHRALRAAVAALRPAQIEQTPAGRKTSNRAVLHGVALHDVYHGGQVQLLKAMARRAAVR